VLVGPYTPRWYVWIFIHVLPLIFCWFPYIFFGVSSIINSINLLGTTMCCRRKFFFWFFVSLFVWGVGLASLLLLLCLPILAGGVTMLLFDRNFNTSFYDFVGGGDLLLFQHLFWFFGHPEVYVIIIPVFGLLSSIIDCCTMRFVFSCVAMIYSLLLICLVGFFVWAHHMFLSGMDLDSRTFFGCLTLLIGLPTAIKLFNWLFCFIFCDVLCVEIWVFFLFCVMFLFGGVTGLLLANVGLDMCLHDTYFVVAHFHYVLSLGAVLGFLCGLLFFFVYFYPVDFNFFFLVFGLLILLWGVCLLFLPMHFLGLLAFPRRITDYPHSFLCFGDFFLLGFFCVWLFVFFGVGFFCWFFVVGYRCLIFCYMCFFFFFGVFFFFFFGERSFFFFFF